jgi:hypothetical protein
MVQARIIPGDTDSWPGAVLVHPGECESGQTRRLRASLSVYGTGALIAALAPGLGLLVVGYSAFEGLGRR